MGKGYYLSEGDDEYVLYKGTKVVQIAAHQYFTHALVHEIGTKVFKIVFRKWVSMIVIALFLQLAYQVITRARQINKEIEWKKRKVICYTVKVANNSAGKWIGH